MLNHVFTKFESPATYWLNTLTPSSKRSMSHKCHAWFLALIRLKWLQFSLILKMLFIIVFLGFKCIYIQIFTCYVVNLDSVGLKRKLKFEIFHLICNTTTSATLQHQKCNILTNQLISLLLVNFHAKWKNITV